VLVADIFVTTKNRPDLLRASLESLRENTDRSLFRLTVVRDGDFTVSEFVLKDFTDLVDYTIVHRENEGLAPAINHALAHIEATNRYFQGPQAADLTKVTNFVCYNQDDLLFTPKWLETLVSRFSMFEKVHKLGFASGVESIEHAVSKDLGGGMVLKPWIRAAQMFARREYWMSMWPIPRFDPETQQIRARPNDGMGSGVDWWFVRNHENSVVKSGRTCLVIPGLVLHAGYRDSTWLKRELPESEHDKQKIRELCAGS